MIKMDQLVSNLIVLTPQEEAEKQSLISRLHKSEQVKEYFTQENIPTKCIDEQPFTIADFFIDKKKCESCMGLAHCVQARNGYLLSLQYDSVLYKQHVACTYMKEKQSILSHKKQFLLCHMSEEQLSHRLDKVDLQSEQAPYLLLYKEIYESFAQGYEQGMYLCGQVGSGKTYLACCIVNEFAKQKKTCSFVNVARFMSDLKSNMYDNAAYTKLIRSLRVADVLVLDDIGGENVSVWCRDEVLFSILNERMDQKRLTFFTSNYDLSNLLQHFNIKGSEKHVDMGAIRLMERIETLSIQKVVQSPNRRVKKR